MKSSKQQRRFMRFSLAALLLFFAAVSVCLAALRYATAGWVAGAVSVTVGLIIVALATGAGNRGARRAFWIAFAGCGSAYLVTTMSFHGEFVEQLVTSKLLAILRDTIHPPSEFSAVGEARPETPPALTSRQAGGVPGVFIEEWRADFGDDYAAMNTNFVLIGQCIWSLILATFGGMIARFTFHCARTARSASLGVSART